MLVNSSVVKGDCPICGAKNSTCGGPTSDHVELSLEVSQMEGPLERVEIEVRPGVKTLLKMTPEQADKVRELQARGMQITGVPVGKRARNKARGVEAPGEAAPAEMQTAEGAENTDKA